MSILVIPRFSDALAWRATVPLEGVEYIFDYYWSERETKWYLALYNQDNDLLAGWMALNVTTAPLRRFRAQSNIPPGVLLVVDTTGQDEEMTAPEELGARVILSYITSDDPLIAGQSLVGVG